MKKTILILSIIASLTVISYIFISCTTTPQKGSKLVQISNNQQISEWRAENRTGVSGETGLLKSWPKNGPELVWTNQDLPMGYSSVSIGNKTIYVTGNDKGNDILVAIDADGKTKWKTEYGRAWTGASPESRCTPTVEGDKIYVSSGNGDLACVDGNTGTVIWSLKASEKFKGT
jgi:outer membrane protein assembly factor BamB